MKWLIQILTELVKKITPKQSFITILLSVSLTACYFIYKEYNDTRVELARISPAPMDRPSEDRFTDKPDYFIVKSMKQIASKK